MIAISLDPADTRERHGVDSYALRREVYGTPLEPPEAKSAPTHTPSESSGLRSVLRRVPSSTTAVRAARHLARVSQALVREAASLPKSWRALDGVDLVIVAGSNQLLDQFGGAWNFPYTLLRWTVLTRLRGARVALLSVGAGPFAGRLACSSSDGRCISPTTSAFGTRVPQGWSARSAGKRRFSCGRTSRSLSMRVDSWRRWRREARPSPCWLQST